MKINDDLSIANVAARFKAPTPAFFQKLRLIGLILTGVGAALLASPVVLPVALIAAAGYIFTAGAVIAAVSSVTTPAETAKIDSSAAATEAVNELKADVKQALKDSTAGTTEPQ